ncbi:MAG: serine/threonine protein phosphatase [Lachnospiraceae bacterium]|nr:serine/threonine protein phosphatase [Lachnospiraceae bacterium]
MSYVKRLNKAFANAPVLPLGLDSRYVLFSDCHRGNGSSNDNFLKNQHLYFAALQYYFQRGYTYIELGDGDELWENRSMEQIIDVHSNAFWMMARFYQQGRLHLLFGNHDMVKKYARYTSRTCSSYFCTQQQNQAPLFPNLQVQEACILEDNLLGPVLYLTHGHQADLWNSVFWRVTRSLVRYLWGPLERLGFLDPTSAAKNYKVKEKTEKRLVAWAKAHHCLLICGHTHRPMIGSAQSPYCNTGSCVHPRCITCLELRCRKLTLVKWSMLTRGDGSLYVGREELTESVGVGEVFGG